MGIKTSPDIFQAVINDLLGDLDFAQVYLDDILIVKIHTRSIKWYLYPQMMVVRYVYVTVKKRR
jgi:hypothetical protein